MNVADVSFGVANVGFDARVVDAAFHRDANVGLTVANIGFEAGVADVAFHRDANVGLTVANIGFEAGVAEAAFRTVDVADVAFRVTDVADAGFGHVEAGEPHDATKEPFPPDAQLTVANVGFDATTGKPRDAGDAG